MDSLDPTLPQVPRVFSKDAAGFPGSQLTRVVEKNVGHLSPSPWSQRERLRVTAWPARDTPAVGNTPRTREALLGAGFTVAEV